MENEDQNLIELLRQALLFYANQENYEQNQNAGSETSSLIELDNGNQARFALSSLDSLKDYKNEMEVDYLKNIDEAIKNEESPENILKIIEVFKNIANND